MFKKLTLYVVRISKHNGKPVESTPCEDCVKTIRLLNLKRIVYVGCDGEVTSCRPEELDNGVRCAGKRFMSRTGIIDELPPSRLRM